MKSPGSEDLRLLLEASLAAVGPQIEASRAELAEAQARVEEAESRLNRYLGVANSLAAALNNDDSTEPDVHKPRTKDYVWTSGTSFELGPSGTLGSGRVRSTDLVVTIIESMWPNTITRDDVVEEAKKRGGTVNMQDPRNGINAALYRAAKQERIERVDEDTFRAWPPGEPRQGLTDEERDLL